MIYHVSIHGCDRAAGTADAPLRTISCAAELALPGDTVQIHTGTYREWVKPVCSGLNDVCRITFEAAPGEKPVIKGSEVVTDWTQLENGLWTAAVPNSLFPDRNPFAEAVWGDWLLEPIEKPRHTGEVYLNGQSLYEAATLEECAMAPKREGTLQPPWDPRSIPHPHAEETVYQWYAEVTPEETVFYLNCQDLNPNEGLVEITVRRACFYPTRHGVNYITVRGLEMCQCATPWTPPTADQPGIIGPHWSKGWLIEDCEVHSCKGSGISLGKDEHTGHNLYTLHDRKPGYTYQMEAVFLALQQGWSKETVGGHIVRNNVIHHCGQNGIVGHMGCAFSLIEHNHIYEIATKYEYFGYEIAAIKFHAAVDTIIRGNCIHDSSLGIWLDWEAQGTRVTGNVLFGNDRDFMVEVTHGPCLVDNNIFASDYAMDNAAQGTAFVHNLICGFSRHVRVMERATPYHFPHTTQVAGCIFVYGGDDRLYNNLFAGQSDVPETFSAGCSGYDFCNAPEDYHPLLAAEGNTDEAKFAKVMQPVYVGGNVYCGSARPFCKEQAPHVLQASMPVQVTLEDGCAVLRITLPEEAADVAGVPVSTQSLGSPRVTEAPFDNPDGTPVDFAPDMLGDCRHAAAIPGPIADLKAGENRVTVWQL
ncbi:MAG: right-handed parallel beta-helix repeat-containing protein [Clostridia bacterium]|nr:right-handed parallel beta-helix repeat-containing protein [Clostridia bacterium]